MPADVWEELTTRPMADLEVATAEATLERRDPPWLTVLEGLAAKLAAENRALGLMPRPTLTLIKGGRENA